MGGKYLDILYGSPTTSERTVRVAVALGDSLKLLVSLLKETFDQRETPYWNSQETGVAYIHQSVLLSILYILMECHRDDEEFMVELANTGLSSYLLQRLSEYAMTLEQVLQLIPIRKLLLVLSRSLSVSFHSLNTETRKSFRSGQESVSCHARADDFRRQKEARDTFRVQVPQAFEEADAIVRRSLHQCPDSYLTEELPLASRLEDALSHLAVCSLFSLAARERGLTRQGTEGGCPIWRESLSSAVAIVAQCRSPRVSGYPFRYHGGTLCGRYVLRWRRRENHIFMGHGNRSRNIRAFTTS